jgi:hypothetical protein
MLVHPSPTCVGALEGAPQCTLSQNTNEEI